jgi:hypothetical protein
MELGAMISFLEMFAVSESYSGASLTGSEIVTRRMAGVGSDCPQPLRTTAAATAAQQILTSGALIQIIECQTLPPLWGK